MRSKDKLTIERVIMKWDGRPWVKIKVKRQDGMLIPSFEDIFYIVHEICECEDIKYPEGQGRFMVRSFLRDCCEMLRPTIDRDQELERRWHELKAKYRIPDR